MRKELHVSHIPQPPKPVTIPLSSKKKTKNKKQKNKKKQELRMRIFFRLPNKLERSKRDRYIFIRTQLTFRLSG